MLSIHLTFIFDFISQFNTINQELMEPEESLELLGGVCKKMLLAVPLKYECYVVNDSSVSTR